MSSPTLSTGLPDPTSGSGGSPGDGGGGMQRGASYFFGFLITFVVLLLIFVGCGVVSRRRFSARQRARFEWDMEPWAERTDGGVGYVAPALAEKTFTNAKDESLWKDLIPLAALVVSSHQEKRNSDVAKDVPTLPLLSTPSQTPYSPPVYGGRDIDNLEVITRTLSAASRRRSESLTRVSSRHSGLVRITSPMPYHRNPNVILAQHEAAQQDSRQQQQHGQEQEGTRQGQEPVLERRGWRHYLNLASWIRPLARRRERGASGDMEQGIQGASYDEKLREARVSEQKDTVLQVAMLIEMPSQSSHTPEHGERPPLYEFGVASIPWTNDFDESSCPGRRSSSSD